MSSLESTNSTMEIKALWSKLWEEETPSKKSQDLSLWYILWVTFIEKKKDNQS